MYLMITTSKYKDKIYKSAKIVRGYKSPEGKSRQEIIKKLGPIKSKDDEIRFRQILTKMKEGFEIITQNDVNYINAKSYGVYYVVKAIFKKYEITKILKNELTSNHKFPIYDIIQALIVNRLENPLSKNKAFDYIQKDYPQKINCKKDNLYLAMDVLQDKKESIELQLFETLKSKLNLNLSKSHYDITSTYFEGKKCEIAFFGYSRDHRKDRRQIVIGLLLVDGIPIYHEVFKGNTQDKTTVTDIVDILQNKFKLKTTTIIGDRGMLSEKNIKDLEERRQKYIIGFSKDGNKTTEELLKMNIEVEKEEFQAALLVKSEEVISSINDKEIKSTRNFILCIDKNTKKEQIETLEEVKKYIKNNLTDLRTSFIRSQQNKKGIKQLYENLIPKVKKIIKRNKNLFTISWNKDKINGFDFKLNESWYKREVKAAGKFIILTNENNKEAIETLKNYKELNYVESSFNCVKNQLDIRPINHYKELRVKSHVFICILALLTEKIIERLLKNMTAQSAIDELKRITIAQLEINEKIIDKKSIFTKPQIEILKKLKIQI